MRLLLSKFIRTMTTNEVKTMPNKCYAMFYLPKSNDDICDCIDRCKYDPPGSGINNYKFTITKSELTDEQQISLNSNN
jgi:hypothetical protein